MNQSAAELLGPNGIIATRLPGYEVRPEQLELARAIDAALRERRHLLAEAGTGVGKSFAYLLPAVLLAADRRLAGPVVLSTRTIALQQQLEHKDLPFLQQVLPLEWTAVTAVGRNNYVCLRRLHLAHTERGLLFADPERQRQLIDVMQWSLATHDGTRMDLPAPVDPQVWDEVQAETGNCLHRACKHYEPCHYQRARRRMDGAQLLVVNHALYMADVGLRLAGAAYLPHHEVVIFDEAHHLERVATEHLGLRITEGTVRWHLRRLHAKNAKRSLLEQYGSPRARHLYHECDGAAAAFFAELEHRLGGAADAIALGRAALDAELAERLGELGTEVVANSAAIREVDRQTEMKARGTGLLALQAVLTQLSAPPASEDVVRWVERDRRGPALRSAPLDVAPVLQQGVFANRTAILVSATLEVGPDPTFPWIRAKLGIGEAETLRVGSPFDYSKNVRVQLEEALPDPSQQPRAFLDEASARVRDLVLDNGGRALVLCTSWTFVRTLANHLAADLADAGLPLLVQGQAPLHRLLEQKKAAPTSVLIGTDSLWEGIDVPGDALTLVIVTRFPFQRPDHPLTKARLRAIEMRGGHAFMDQTLPEAVLRFRQGFGRLVRAAGDRGRVVVLDPRARTKAYGRQFLDALPAGALDEPEAERHHS
ncbi:MAG: helicase C-terminal domain-containing protein [Planctomycetota bacterium]